MHGSASVAAWIAVGAAAAGVVAIAVAVGAVRALAKVRAAQSTLLGGGSSDTQQLGNLSVQSLAVTDSALVPNLNSGMLDGKRAADFVAGADKGTAGGVATLDASGRLSASQMPALAGAVTSVAGTTTTALTPVVTAGSCGDALHSCGLTFNAAGQITAVTNNAIPAGSSTIASGTAALGTSAVPSGTCASAVTVSTPGVTTTDVVTAGFSGDPTTVTGYGPSASGMLTIIPYATTDSVNFKVGNNTGASVR